MSNLKKVLALVLVFALSLTMFAGAITTEMPFKDLDKLTAEQSKSLELLYALGVIVGDGEENVNPTDTLTRGELAAILYRLYTGDVEEKYISTYTTTSPYFTDSDNAWYTPYVNWAYLKGVIVGYGDGRFGPKDNVTGVQAATMLARLTGLEIGSDNWELVSRKHAIDLGLDKGVESTDLFGTNLTRGNMIVMVANVLGCKEVDSTVTLIDKIFDVEIIYGAVLHSVEKLGSTKFSLFSFKDLDDVKGDVRRFSTDRLSVEDEPSIDEIGQKYTLYVAKTKQVNGYRYLYAAFHEDENAYYSIVTGTVDDKKLVTDDSKSDYIGNKVARRAQFYVNGVLQDDTFGIAKFLEIYGKKNSGTYKLIDTDGDGKYEYFFIEKLNFAQLKNVETVIASVSQYSSKNNNITYTLSNGETYSAGQYWGYDNDKKEYKDRIDVQEQLDIAIGTGSQAVTDVQYEFTIENGKYIMKIAVCDATKFSGNYVLGFDKVGDGTYQGAPYIRFLTENNATMYAYVRSINSMTTATYINAIQKLDAYTQFMTRGNVSVYDFVFGENLFYINASNDVFVDLYTPDFYNAYLSGYVNNYTDKWDIDTYALKAEGKFMNYAGLSAQYKFVLKGEEYNPKADYAALSKVLDDVDSNYEYYFVYDSSIEGGSFRRARRGDSAPFYQINDYFMKDENTFKGMMAAVDNSDYNNVNRYTDIPLILTRGHVDATYTEFKVDITLSTNDNQIFKMYGNWYIQSYYGVSRRDDASSRDENYGYTDAYTFVVQFKNIEDNWKTVTYKSGIDGSGGFLMADDGVTVFSTGYSSARSVNRIIANAIEDAVDAEITARGSWSESGYWGIDPTAPFGYIYKDAVKLNASNGVIFAYGRDYFNNYNDGWNNTLYQWRAYTLNNFSNENFGQGGYGDDYTRWSDDQLIYTDIGGVKYIKAAKVTVYQNANDFLPYDWMADSSYDYKFFILDGTPQKDYMQNQTNYVMATPNGGREYIWIKHELMNNWPALDLSGALIYAAIDEDGNVTRTNYITNLDELGKYAKENNLATKNVKAMKKDGNYTYDTNDAVGISKSGKLDLEKTFYYAYENGVITFRSASSFLDKYTDATLLVVYTIGDYNFVTLKPAPVIV